MSDGTAEEWRGVVGCGSYEVSSEGRMRSSRRSPRRPLSVWVNRDGYLVTWVINDEGRRLLRLVHRLVAEAFLGPCPDGHEVRHLDDNRVNDRLSNLAYGTSRDNRLDSVRNGTHANAAKTHCAQGHPYDAVNTYRPPGDSTRRYCRACVKAVSAARYRRKKAARQKEAT